MLGNFSLVVGSTLLAFMFFILFFASIGFMAGLPLTTVTIGLALTATLVYSLVVTKVYGRQEERPRYWKVCFTAIFLFLSCMYIGGSFYDISYDGQVYHQEAVGQLGHKWNPFQDYLTKDRSHSAVLLNHYAKGPWIYEAALYLAREQIEQSKGFNFLLIIISFFLSFSTLKYCQNYSDKETAFFSLLMALNPVSIYQAFSFYIDGQMASLLVCLFALAYRLVKEYDWLTASSFIMSIALTVNIKFTGVVYVVVIMALTGCWLYVFKHRHLYKTFFRVGVIGLFIGIGIIGYNPYITNLVYYGHPFYPLYGAGPNTMDIMTSNSPQGFMQKNPLEKLYIASFSRSTNQFDREEPTLKIPFTLQMQELKPFVYGADIRIGGFGPWFSGMLVIACMIFLGFLRFSPQKSIYSIGLVFSIMLSVLINPEAWWARYVPQFWLVPIILAIAASRHETLILRYLGKALTGAAVVNLILITYSYVLGNYYCTQSLDRQLQTIAKQNQPIQVCFGDFTSNYVRFTKWGIEYVDIGDDVADINIEEIRYKCLTTVFEEPLLADIFSDERMDKYEK